jgi:hypothetical protein
VNFREDPAQVEKVARERGYVAPVLVDRTRRPAGSTECGSAHRLRDRPPRTAIACGVGGTVPARSPSAASGAPRSAPLNRPRGSARPPGDPLPPGGYVPPRARPRPSSQSVVFIACRACAHPGALGPDTVAGRRRHSPAPVAVGHQGPHPERGGEGERLPVVPSVARGGRRVPPRSRREATGARFVPALPRCRACTIARSVGPRRAAGRPEIGLGQRQRRDRLELCRCPRASASSSSGWRRRPAPSCKRRPGAPRSRRTAP